MFYPAGEVKVKIFQAYNPQALEEDANKFMEEVKNFVFVSFKVTTRTKTHTPRDDVVYTGTLVYSAAMVFQDPNLAEEDGVEGFEYPGGFHAKSPNPYVPSADLEEEEKENG